MCATCAQFSEKWIFTFLQFLAILRIDFFFTLQFLWWKFKKLKNLTPFTDSKFFLVTLHVTVQECNDFWFPGWWVKNFIPGFLIKHKSWTKFWKLQKFNFRRKNLQQFFNILNKIYISSELVFAEIKGPKSGRSSYFWFKLFFNLEVYFLL